ncbi:DUF5979 domain-containing protein [Agrococcus sp. Marseille-Q4369]|uniref:DUF5979 domain-containing protein n=1 Tax=Agrococcus sp. Marseille-Q4369 TaxID=2810513 RepID=UPI001B8B3A9E|nr:DUF5979 domain-containing protein [Agrococcus sp. Marseille-Q4369]QUW19803.1 hypothetical protein JSQ78_05840 [Agrococcus sp. Marseille-Q4369]
MRRAAAAGLAALITVATLIAAPTTAHAAQNPNIVVRDVTITTVDGEPATIGEAMTLSGTWDATDADPHAGDVFTVGLPAELGFPAALPFQLSGADGTVWGNCLTDPATDTLTCTLTDAVVEFPELVFGTFELQIEAVEATTEESVVLDLNGKLTSVDLPGIGGIDDGITLPTGWTKTGALNADKWSMRWTIELPGSRLAAHEVVTIRERVSDNHELCTPSNLRIETVRGSTVVNVTSIGSTADGVEAGDAFSIVLTAPEGGFDANVTYRVRYDTCTPDREIDAQGTVYTNEAIVDVWGESSGGIGVRQDWAITALVDKTGSVLGRADRNGVIQWAVTVAGDHLVGRDTVTLSEALEGLHALCTNADGAPEVRGLTVLERYGPSGSRQRTIPASELRLTTTQAEAEEFKVELATQGDFAFQGNDYMYVIRYQTCATTDGLPASGTEFGNRATIAGVTDGATATVPSRTVGKNGQINGSNVELDGVTYLPQTTLGWQITLPGQEIAEVETDLTITDVLSDDHEVCVGSGGDVADRLGLRVEARDQIQDGGLRTVDLSESATATLDGSTITITVPRPTLPGVDGQAVEGFSHEYQYVVRYTTCTRSGGMDAPGTEYGNDARVEGLRFTRTVEQRLSGSGTGQGVTRGSVSIDKALETTPGAAFVPEGAAFTVHVRERDPRGTVQAEYDLRVPLDGEPVSGPNPRGRGWTMELSEPRFPSVPGVTFGAPRFEPSEGLQVSADGTTAIATITPALNIGVTLTNTALLGSLEVVKAVEGGAAGLVDAEREYAMTASIDVSALGAGFPAQPDREFTLVAGEPVVLDDLPIGATVTLSESPLVDDDAFTWGEPSIEPNGVLITPGHSSEPSTITVTNHVERTVGTFSLSKLVTGAQAGSAAVPESVSVTASWVQEGVPGSVELEVPTDGTPVPLGHALLIGTEVSLTEAPLVDGSSIAWGAPVWSGDGVEVSGSSAIVTIGRDADALVSLENHAATSTAGLSFVKGIAGEAAEDVPAGATFPITASWVDADGVERSRELEISASEPTPLGVELPAGTVVTVTEGERPELPTVDWGSIVISGEDVTDAGDGSATVVVSDLQGDSTLVTVVNEATWAPGTFTITKQLEGIALGHADAPASVTVMATWTTAYGTEQCELDVATDGTPTPFGGELPYGTEVTLSEAMPASTPAFRWDAPRWSGDDVEHGEAAVAVVTIGAATDSAVLLTNTAIAEVGSLAVSKELEGSGASDVPEGTTFPIVASWTDLMGEERTLETEVAAGAAVTLEQVPVGVPIRIVEDERELPAGTTWTGAEWTSLADTTVVPLDGTTGATVTLGAATASIELVNGIDARELPRTGAELGQAQAVVLSLAAVLLLLGAVLVLAAGRRRSEA